MTATGPMPPCKTCNEYHSIVFDDITNAIIAEQDMEEFCRIAIRKYFAAKKEKGFTSNWYYRSLKPLQAYIRLHFPQYLDILEKYIILI